MVQLYVLQLQHMCCLAVLNENVWVTASEKLPQALCVLPILLVIKLPCTLSCHNTSC